ncbi:MAG: hypothetical protein A2233_01600 [Candidatus Kerfeldbacteria bacterium RIFOXYA2_FULL_38_24]|uniref:Phosphatase n=1 Tax=Candidatus Kerfeldbacteria bacterium RIFOXYB2_FULL_38_14 TaxID=1798547 RepID=A0A1G2BF00_9BACT|nr:MAG: hypothetical protein A2319_04210 [Candidatus Kerfeldbacteria bacterium RIFOXYB2_FULL_38_14]OGY87813.1 MAG: hypothetical protein A2233_01600 [Candidatus Kerfeldbacteria bacterium RIFOXYA2_FULL_38_24]OGY89548.1 MAG: hypothetical protein A2458_00345 [Candidatus Kerfeldbacteria bacterium RIFOXYC2_FULL_38_9]
MIQAFIFDMDGVIIDSEPLQLQSFNHVLKKYNIIVSMPEFKEKYMGYKDIQICEKIIDDYNLSLTKDEFVSNKRAAYLKILKQGTIEPISGAVEAIKEISSLMPIAIASSSNKLEIETIIGRFGVRDLFLVLVSASEVKNGKPAPDVYLRVAKLMNIDPNKCGVIEDTQLGVHAAKNAGMYCIGITTTHTKDELQDADRVIDSFEHLMSAIQRVIR